MRIVAILVLMSFVAVVVWGIGVALYKWSSSRPPKATKLSNPERQELKELRKLKWELTRLVVENGTGEHFVTIVRDELGKTEIAVSNIER